MEILLLVSGLVAGAALSALYFFSRTAGKSKASDIQLQQLYIEKAQVEERLKANELQLAEARLKVNAQEQIILGLNQQLSTAIANVANVSEQLVNQKKEVEQIQEQLKADFQNLSTKILEENSKKFTEQNKTNLETLLTPFKDRIMEFSKKVDDGYKAEAAERNSLKGEIKSLIELNKQISEEANNLAKALRGDTKKQGNWGEVILERILERSGLVKGSEYDVQFSTSNDEGRKIQPDVVIYLPDQKHLIVDAKVSLVAYEAFVNADDEDERVKFLREHLASVKSHIKILSEKSYETSVGLNTPDFVLLFMPIESSFGLAVQADQELFSFAWDRKIVIVSPTTLLATLRTISSIWKQEKQTRNAIEIASQAGKLYDKFVGLMEDLNMIGKRLDEARRSQDEAMKKLSTGPGNVLRKMEELKKLGAKTAKEIPAAMLDEASE